MAGKRETPYRAYFRPVKPGTCPCGARRAELWSMGEYIRAKWHTVDHFCPGCFATRILGRVVRTWRMNNTRPLEFVGYHCSLPSWITLDEEASHGE